MTTSESNSELEPKTPQLKLHPELKALIPPLHPSELKALEESIREEGVRDKIITWNGFIVDGHNRYEIAKKLNLTLTEDQIIKKDFKDIEEAKVYVKKNQLGRRNLAFYLKAEYLMDIAEWEEKRKQASANQLGGTSVPIDTRVDINQDLADKLGVSRNTAFRIKQIHDKASEEIKDKCRTGEMSINEAFKKIQNADSELPEQQDAQVAINLPMGKYRTIVVDPPLPVEQGEHVTQVSTSDYPVMSLDEIRNLPIKGIADKDCHLYLWTTHLSLPAALSLLKSWGFKYYCLLTWVKNIGPTPVSWTFSTEHCLFGVKGKFERNEVGVRVDFRADAMEHSQKPNCFYETVKKVSSGPFIDIFSREKHEGFTAWGFEDGKTRDVT